MSEGNELLQEMVVDTIAGKTIGTETLSPLLTLTPQELTDIIMSNPPVEKIISPTPEELDHAQKSVNQPNLAEDEVPSFKIGIQIIQDYLGRPKIKDTFPDHNQRSIHEDALNTVLYKLDKVSGYDSKVHTPDKSYTVSWKKVWDNNKYTLASRQSVSGFTKSLAELQSLPEDKKEKLQEYATQLKALVKQPDEEVKKGLKPDLSTTDEEVDKISKIAIAVIDLFS